MRDSILGPGGAHPLSPLGAPRGQVIEEQELSVLLNATPRFQGARGVRGAYVLHPEVGLGTVPGGRLDSGVRLRCRSGAGAPGKGSEGLAGRLGEPAPLLAPRPAGFALWRTV